MSGRRNMNPEPNILVRGAYRDGPPECWRCGKNGQPGFVGEPNDEQSPYLFCDGDPARHQRTPVTVRP